MKKELKTLIYTFLTFIIVNILYLCTFKTFIPCMFHKITGLFCPGCGISRMCISIMKLEFYQAFRFNPFIFSLVLSSIIYLIIKLITYKLLTKKIKLNNYVYLIIMIAAILFGIFRNLPVGNYFIPTVVK